MNINTLTLDSNDFPEALRQIKGPPQRLFHAGAPLTELLKRPRVAIVGSRKASPYGQQVTYELARQLAEQGIVVISGLALGIDSIAHQTTLDAKGLTIGVLPGAIEQIYPASHVRLAERIIKQGGALISEYPDGTPGFKQYFVARNRLVAGLSQAVLITEAAEGSGTLHTARFAQQQGKPVLAVPGNISNPGSAGVNQLIKEGATLVTSYKDVVDALGLKEHGTITRKVKGSNEDEQTLLDLLLSGINNGEQLLKRSGQDITKFNQTLVMLEIDGKIRSLGSNQWSLS